MFRHVDQFDRTRHGCFRVGDAQVNAGGVSGVLLKLQHPGALPGQRAGMVDEPLESQDFKKSERRLDIAYHLCGVEDIAHTVKLDAFKRRAQALHHGHHDAIILNVKALARLHLAELPGHCRDQLTPTMGVQKLARPVAVPGAHVDIKQPTRSGHRAIQRAKHRSCVRNGQQNHFTCPAGR